MDSNRIQEILGVIADSLTKSINTSTGFDGRCIYLYNIKDKKLGIFKEVTISFYYKNKKKIYDIIVINKVVRGDKDADMKDFISDVASAMINELGITINGIKEKWNSIDAKHQ